MNPYIQLTVEVNSHTIHADIEWCKVAGDWFYKKLEIEWHGWKREIYDHLLSNNNYALITEALNNELHRT